MRHKCTGALWLSLPILCWEGTKSWRWNCRLKSCEEINFDNTGERCDFGLWRIFYICLLMDILNFAAVGTCLKNRKKMCKGWPVIWNWGGRIQGKHIKNTGCKMDWYKRGHCVVYLPWQRQGWSAKETEGWHKHNYLLPSHHIILQCMGSMDFCQSNGKSLWFWQKISKMVKKKSPVDVFTSKLIATLEVTLLTAQETTSRLLVEPAKSHAIWGQLHCPVR